QPRQRRSHHVASIHAVSQEIGKQRRELTTRRGPRRAKASATSLRLAVQVREMVVCYATHVDTWHGFIDRDRWRELAPLLARALGGGGMSRVFLARENALGRTVVVKVLLPLLAAGIRAERFAREVRVAAALQHPNIVALFTAGEAAGLPYYVMPYVQGESLRA